MDIADLLCPCSTAQNRSFDAVRMQARSSDRGDFAQAAIPCSALRASAVLCSAAIAAAATIDGRAAAGAGTAAISADLRREFQAGVDAYRLGKYDEARSHLARAQALDPKLPGPHRFLAAVASAQHQWTECITEARRAIQLNPRSQEIADTRRLHEQCRASAGRPAYRTELGDAAAVAVTANVAGAIVRIEGLRYGGTPLAPLRIKPGAHEVAIAKDGYKPAHRAIDALPGIVTDIDVELEPELPISPRKPPANP